MKRTTIGFVVTILAVVLFGLFNTVSATLDADSVLYIPRVMAGNAPEIDGEMDAVWYTVTNTLMIKDCDAASAPDDWFDNSGIFKLLYDATNIYGYVNIKDDVIGTEAANTYEQDGIEIYFDGDNSKNPEQTYDGVDDVQLRFNTTWTEASEVEVGYGNSGADWGFVKDGIVFAFGFTDLGYVLEFSIPLAALKIEGVPEWSFGFEIQTNDNDEGAREAAKRWWHVSNNSWYDPTLFGNAEFDDYDTEARLRVVKAQESPVIDGVMDAPWDLSPDFSSNCYVDATAYVPDETWNVYDKVDDWNDMDFDFRLMWDDEYIYFFAEVYDDMISVEAGGDWEKDSFELYFDGDNSKNDYTNDAVGYDSNDKQVRTVYTDAPLTDNYACAVTDFGWTMEWRISYDGDALGWVPEENLEIGFEVQFNDQDDPTLIRSGMARWWGSDNNTWLDGSMMGTAVLVLSPNEVKEATPSVAASYKLAQNYPNPFNPSTTIDYSVATRGNVTLTVFDMLGKEVATLVNEVKAAGTYSVNFNASNLPSGVYFYKLNNGSQVLTQKMMLIK